jgi:glycosyltransferase involved in cell wall biosynthesis
MSELVSILVPAYNAAPWIRSTLKSAIEQSWPDKEIIVVDDGSTDATFAIANQFASASVKVVTQQNSGAAAARNAAFKLAQGSHIQYLDADDLLARDKIARQLNGCERGCDSLTLLSAAWARFLYSPKRAQARPDCLWEDLAPADWLMTKFLRNTFMPPAAWLISRRLAEAAGPWDERLSLDDDGEYAARLVTRSKRVRFVPDARCYYRIGNQRSLSWRRSEQALDSLFLSMSLSIEHLRALEDSERTRLAALTYLSDSFALFYPDSPRLVARAHALAAVLGGRLSPRVERPHVAAVSRVLGPRNARRAKHLYSAMKTAGRRGLERLLYDADPG